MLYSIAKYRGQHPCLIIEELGDGHWKALVYVGRNQSLVSIKAHESRLEILEAYNA